MTSKCPNCTKSNDHEDYLFEVVCTCGSRYNPFLSDTGQGAQAAEEPIGLETFQESNAAFAEIREFVENQGSAPKETPPAKSASAAPRSAASSAPISFPDSSGNARWMTGGDTLPGVEAILGVVSAAGPCDWDQPDPMGPVTNALWGQVQARGGNGCVALRCVLSPDGSRVLAYGTAVRCGSQGT